MAVDAMDIDSNPVPAGQAESEKERKRKHKTKDEPSSSFPSKKKRKHEKGEKEKDGKKKDKSSKSGKDKEKKSKSKSSKSDSTPATNATNATTTNPPAAKSIPDSPYTLTTATLYLPLSPISISPTHALASLLAEHLSPLLLTYYPPLEGIVLAYSNASISSSPRSSPNSSQPTPQPLTLAATAGEYGVMYVYLTATFLVFRPQRGQTLEGWVNVQSEGFLGAVVLNLFSVGIERKRLPSSWKWIPPGEEDEEENGQGPTANSTEDEDEDKTSTPFDPEIELFTPVPLATDSNPFNLDLDAEQTQTQTQNTTEDPTAETTTTALGTDETDTYEGHFASLSGHHVRGTIKFRVVDIDVIPGTERDRGFISIEGSMLSDAEEKRVVEDERNGVLASSNTPLRRFTVPMHGSSADGTVSVKDVELDAPGPAEGEEGDGDVQESPSKDKGKGKKKSKK